MDFRIGYIFFVFFVCTINVGAQQRNSVSLTLEQAFSLARKNSEYFKISRKSVDIATQRIEVEKLRRLPSLSTSLDYGYISNSQIWSPDFSNHTSATIPHHFTQLNLQFTQLLYKGGEVGNSIAQRSLDQEYSNVSFQKDEIDILTQVAFDYLEIFNLKNQGKVLYNNLSLAGQRLKNILTLQKQGMVTNNDVLRTKLQISDLELAIRRNVDNLSIKNEQLNMILGLDGGTSLTPDSALIKRDNNDTRSLDDLFQIAFANNKSLKLSRIDSAKSSKSVESAKSDRYPELALYAGSSLQRPFLYTIPAIDIYTNVWQTGLSLKYNISSLYQAPRKIKESKLRLEQAINKQNLQLQQLKVDLNTAFVKYKLAEDELRTYREDQLSARENYRIVERKYFNQLSLLADMIDAANTKTAAELKVSNAEINVVFTFYQLSRVLGTL